MPWGMEQIYSRLRGAMIIRFVPGRPKWTRRGWTKPAVRIKVSGNEFSVCFAT